MADFRYITDIGNYLIIQITGIVKKYIAEIIRSEPLIVKVMEEGPYAKLKAASGDFIILKSDTIEFQADCINDTNFYLEKNSPLISGLKSLGIKDGKLREIFAG